MILASVTKNTDQEAIQILPSRVRMAGPPMQNKATTGITSFPQPMGDKVIGNGRTCPILLCNPAAALPWGT